MTEKTFAFLVRFGYFRAGFLNVAWRAGKSFPQVEAQMLVVQAAVL